MIKSKYFWLFFFLGGIFSTSGQFENRLFNGTRNHVWPDTQFNFQHLAFHPNKWGIQALHYLKNNEYLENHNPGATFFGVQVSAARNFSFNQASTHLTLGGMINLPFGDNYEAAIWPLVQFQHQISDNHTIVLGSIHGATRHKLYEPIYNYELALTQPVEYGLQHLYKNARFKSDIWLDWRRIAIKSSSEQEIISFGWSANWDLFPKSHTHHWSIPLSNLIYHRGGEALAVGKPIQNKWNGSLGLRYQYQQNWRWESVIFGSLDFSPELQTSFQDGHGLYHQLHIAPYSKHQLVISHFYGEEFFAPLGTNLFLSEQIDNPYRFENYRNFIMLRYQWLHSLIKEQCVVDFRIEPIWHMEKRQFAFSTGLYIKYIIGSQVY